ncbi:hypothetical protein CBS101457_002603 [Exobasidium rhododendri]|nr:hypothetical protein CBS101457_002603 [Exobasidium rhododendri]
MATQGGSSIAGQLLHCLNYPFAACLPSSSTSRQGAGHERQGLLSENAYDDSDAISLLSNIADRSRRRSRSARRREKWSKRAATLGCGLFGRPRGQIQRREATTGNGPRSQHRRFNSDDSTASRDTSSDGDADNVQSLTGNLSVAQDSGDEDAGMLVDEDIAEISQSREEEGGEEAGPVVPTVHVIEPAHDEEERHQKAIEEEERVNIRATLDREAKETAKAEAEDALRLAEEEAAVAAEEEAAIAKAKRREERRAIKHGLMKVKAEGQRERRRTEAEAEAAAGGFDFAEEVEQEEHRAYNDREERFDYSEEPYEYHSQYTEGGPEEYDYQEQQQQQQRQQEVVHHHHYYHEAQPEEDSFDGRLLSPNFRIADLPVVGSLEKQEGFAQKEEEEDEDDADIAGITFSKSKKSRSREEGGSNTYSRSNGSGSGSRQSGSGSGQRQARYEAHRKGSDHSAEGHSGEGSSTTGGKSSYRDRPRRHERTGSRSTGSGAGGGTKLREGVPSRTMMASPTIPESGDDQADAAAGGFDDLVPSAETVAAQWKEPGQNETYTSDRRGSSTNTGSNSSSGQRRERRKREGVSNGALNMPRNPGGANVFVQSRDGAGYF